MLLAAVVLLHVFFSGAAFAQSGWTVDIGGERSEVELYDSELVWRSEYLQIGWMRQQAGGWFGRVENQQRFGRRDQVMQTGAHLRLGDWTIGGSLGGTPDADFWFRRSYEGELSRRIVGTLVASGAYRYLKFPGTSVLQPQAALTWYHPRGEIQGRLFLTRNTLRDSYSATGLLQTSLQIAPRLQWVGAVARGDRIFDIGALAGSPAQAWLVRSALRIGLTRNLSVEIGGGLAREQPEFEQRTLAFSLRRAF